MDIYRYPPSSRISHIEFTQDAKNVWIARLFPQSNAALDNLSHLTSTLNQRKDGIIAIPQTVRGVHTLYASGFTSPQSLLDQLNQLGATNGAAQYEKTSQEADEFTNKIRDSSLKLAGIFYLISDAALSISGLMSKRYKETIAGALYSSGGVILARYGRKDAHTHLQSLSYELGNFLKKEDIAIPQNSAVMGATQEQKHDLVAGLEKFAYTYPSQIFNSIVAVCGVQLMQSGMIHKKGWDTVSGSLVLGGALAGLLIPEKKKTMAPADPQAQTAASKNQNIFSRIYAWAQEKPLRIPGYLWFGNNIALTISALKERQQNPAQKSYIYKLGYAAAAVIANGMMSISSKEESARLGINAESTQALMAVAAGVIAAQTPATQEHIIQRVSGFLASQGDMDCPAHEVAGCIRDQVAALKGNPFIAKKDIMHSATPEAASSRWQDLTLSGPPAAAPGIG